MKGTTIQQLAIALGAALVAGCAATAPSGGDSSAVERAVQTWVDTFNNCDPVKLSALYDPSAVLWGTVSTSVISTPTGVRQYFERACAAQPSIQVTVTEKLTRMYGNSAVSSGTYNFSREGRNIPARFSLTFHRKEGQWLIVDHHSSKMPTPPDR